MKTGTELEGICRQREALFFRPRHRNTKRGERGEEEEEEKVFSRLSQAVTNFRKHFLASQSVVRNPLVLLLLRTSRQAFRRRRQKGGEKSENGRSKRIFLSPSFPCGLRCGAGAINPCLLARSVARPLLHTPSSPLRPSPSP